MATAAYKSISFTAEDYELIAKLRDKLRQQTGFNVSLAEAAIVATKKELAQMKAEQTK